MTFNVNDPVKYVDEPDSVQGIIIRDFGDGHYEIRHIPVGDTYIAHISEIEFDERLR